MTPQLIIDADMLVYGPTSTHRLEVDWPEATQDPEVTTIHVDLAAARGHILSLVSEWEWVFGAEPGTSILCFSDKQNWRKAIDPSYKAHRKGPKPPGYAKLVDWCERTWKCERWEGLEADDVCGILGTRLDNVILISGDKDFQTIPCEQHDFNRDEPGTTRIPTLKSANRFHLIQAIAGDPTDGYAGCPGIGAERAGPILDGGEPMLRRALLELPKVGEKTADKMLAQGQDAVWGVLKERHPDPDRVLLSFRGGWTGIVQAFKSQGLTEADALRNAQLAYILRDENYNPETGAVTTWQP